MIEKVLEHFRRKGRRRLFSAWQIELTTRCPLQCKMCIRTGNAPWQSQDMSLENFEKILPHLEEVETVVLEGWGESLLHKDLLQCIRLVKMEGPQVGFVTSGVGLTESRAAELIEAGLDFVGFSISGTTPETHDAIRVNSHLPDVLDSVRFFIKQKIAQGLVRPKIHLVFLMLRGNILEVPAAPFLAREMGIEEIVLTDICHTTNIWQEDQKIFTWGEAESDYERFVKSAEANARKLNISLKRPSLTVSDVAVCQEDPLRNLYISADGEVSPCVYLYPPLGSPFKRIFCGQEFWLERVSFGNIFKEPFSAIWNNVEYVRFRESFMQRRKKMKDLSMSIWNGSMTDCLKESRLPDPPEPCRTCHKILGV